MTLRLIGAFLVIAACSGVGFSMAGNYKKQEVCLRQIIKAIDIFSCELEYRLSPLSNICRTVSETVEGSIGQVFCLLADKLEEQLCPDAVCCMYSVLQEEPRLPQICRSYLTQMGQTLGKFDISGQLSELASVKVNCTEALDALRLNRDVRIRNYKTLGLCAGAALAILLI